MAELETLYVRIETDLTAFNAGMAKARTVTQDFAADARDTFSGVGDALDLQKFRNELAVSEKVAKDSAARMKKAFAEVGEVQLEIARQALKILSKSVGAQGGQSGVRAGAKRGQSSSSDNEGLSDYFSVEGAGLGVTIAGILVAMLATTSGAVAFPVSGATLAAFYALSAALGGSMPAMEKLGDALSSDDADTSDPLRKLNDEIGIVQSKLADLNDPRFADQFGEKDLKTSLEHLLAELTSQRDDLLDLHGVADNEFLVEIQRLFGDSAAQFQDFLGAFTELSACLRELCARIDSLAPLPPGGADAPGAQQMRFDGAGVGAGGGIIPASFSGGSPFDGNGLALFNEELEATGWHAGDAAVQIADLTMRSGGYRTEAGALVRVLRANNAVFDDQVGVVRLLDALLPELGAGLTGVFTEAGAAGREFDEVAEALGGTLIAGAALECKSLSDVLGNVINDVLELAQSAIGGRGGGARIQCRDTARREDQAKKMNARITTARKPLTTRLLARFRDTRPQDGHISPAGFICFPQSGQKMSAISC